MTIKVGDKLPSVDLYEGTPQNKVNIAEFAAGKKLVIFGLTGAYTPVCSKSHLPGYVAKVEQFKKKGVDEVVCIAVNDPYVMKSWGDYTTASGVIRMLADTNAEFTKAAGLDVDMTEKLGNVRCKRFALYAEDGVVKHLNIEPDGQGLTVSSAEVMLDTVAFA